MVRLIAAKHFRGRDLYRHLGLRSAHFFAALIPSFIGNAFASEFTVDDHGTMRCGNGASGGHLRMRRLLRSPRLCLGVCSAVTTEAMVFSSFNAGATTLIMRKIL